MAKRAARRVYWDSCCWISLIQKEKIRGHDGAVVEDREGLCKAVIEAAKADAIEIVTSTITLTEVCKEPDGAAEPIASFFENDYIATVNVDKFVSERGRLLMNAGYAGLKPPDAIHLATALTVPDIEAFHTFDVELLALDGVIAKEDGSMLIIRKPDPGGPAAPLLDVLLNEEVAGQ